jgi:DNA helicase HerA-like ATPase
MSQPAFKLPPQSFRERRGVPAAPPKRIGHIVSVNGPRAVAVLERSAEAALLAEPPRVQIGALLKITTPASSVIGLVTAVTTPMPGAEDHGEEIGLVELNLAGEMVIAGADRRLTFKRGVTSPPSIGDALLLVDRHDLTRVYAPPALATVKVGTLYQDAAVAARLRVDDLLSKHFVVVGSTGSGKSCALTTILQRILDDYRYAHIVVLDIHNEYLTAFGDRVEAINLNNFSLPFWLLNFQELTAALTTVDEHRDAETEILGEAVVYAKRRYSDHAATRGALVRKPVEATHMTVETPTPFRLSDVIAYIDEQLGRLERTQITLPYRKLKMRIETMVADQRYNFMFGSLTVQDTMTEILSRLFRVPSDGKPITVIDLSVVPAEILDVVISVISRLAFDLAIWSKGGLPTLIVCEEAHRYAPAVDKGYFGPTRQALSRIAKEGRKYGISLALVTQRPSDLDPTILSQCSTVVALRLSSERDQQVMRSSTHEGVLDLLDFLPLLGDREAIVLGQGVSMPMRITFDDLDRTAVPRNLNAGFSKAWKSPNMNRQELEAIVFRWRQSGRDKG